MRNMIKKLHDESMDVNGYREIVLHEPLALFGGVKARVRYKYDESLSDPRLTIGAFSVELDTLPLGDYMSVHYMMGKTYDINAEYGGEMIATRFWDRPLDYDVESTVVEEYVGFMIEQMRKCSVLGQPTIRGIPVSYYDDVVIVNDHNVFAHIDYDTKLSLAEAAYEEYQRLRSVRSTLDADLENGRCMDKIISTMLSA